MIANTIQTNFTSGEISPLMRGRVDVNKYFGGAKTLLNFLVRPQGGAWRRSGTRHVQPVKTESKLTRLIPFRFSSTVKYMLEFGDGYVRVFKDGAPVMSGGVQVEIVTPWAEADLADLSYTQSADILYVAHGSYQTRKIERTSDTSWSVALYDPEDGPYLDREVDQLLQLKVTVDSDLTPLHSVSAIWSADNVGKIYSIAMRGQVAPAKVITYVDANNVIVKELDFFPRDPNVDVKLTTNPAGDWILKCDHSGYFTQAANGKQVLVTSGAFNHLFIDGGVYQDVTTMYVGTTTTYPNWNDRSNGHYDDQITCGKRVVTLDIKTGDGRSLFQSTDVGRWIRLEFASRWVPAKISSYVSGSNVKAQAEINLPTEEEDGRRIVNRGVTTSFRLSAWSVNTGWPSVIQFHEQRLFFANTSTQPMTVWGSCSGDFENFAPSDLASKVLDTSSLTLVIAANQADPVAWMSSGGVLLIGTGGNEFILKSTNLAEPITPTNFTCPKQTSFGSIEHIPCRAGTATLVIQRAGNKLREMTYSFELDQFVSKDITVISEHILRQGGGALEIAHQPEPANYVWARLADGTLACMTYERDQDVVAWHRHSISGSADASTNGVVESIAVLPNSSGAYDDLYLIVRRTLNGATTRHIEILSADYAGSTLDGPVMLDDCVVGTQVPHTTVAGLPSWMDGFDVYVYADGVALGSFTVTSGETATLPVSVANYVVGFLNKPKIVFLPWEGGSPTGGTSQGKIKRVNNLGIRVERSAVIKYGYDDSHMFRKVLQADHVTGTTTPTSLFSGDVQLSVEAPYARDGTLQIVVDEPYPCIILAAMPVFNTNE